MVDDDRHLDIKKMRKVDGWHAMGLEPKYRDVEKDYEFRAAKCKQKNGGVWQLG